MISHAYRNCSNYFHKRWLSDVLQLRLQFTITITTGVKCSFLQRIEALPEKNLYNAIYRTILNDLFNKFFTQWNIYEIRFH